MHLIGTLGYSHRTKGAAFVLPGKGHTWLKWDGWALRSTMVICQTEHLNDAQSTDVADDKAKQTVKCVTEVGAK